jgi:histidinol-phosphate/aromatic aminotransferase/cobyric acid decarboxylase-like protein/GTP:adenosylcobinamide-phosphate guanylyltransferase
MQGIILAAGMGKRLGELTKDRTKCMITINGVTLLERALNQLSQNNITRVIIVIGYFGDKVRNLIGNTYKGMDIEYIENKIFNKTNNIYSLYLARDWLLGDDTILLESDLIFEDSVIERVINAPYPDIAVVAKYQNWMNGTAIILDEHDTILDFISKQYFITSQKNDYFKTVNIYRFSREFSKTRYVPFLEAYCSAVGHNEYYEQVLRIITLLEDKKLKALRLEKEKWYEIDDLNDFSIAETLFADEGNELESYYQRYGGFWRFPNLLDFCYLVNPYFPSPLMLDEMREELPFILAQYPSGQRVNQILAANIFHVTPNNIVVGNGAAELIKSLQEGYTGITGVIRPTFDEYSNRTDPSKLRVYTPKNKNFSYTSADLLNFVQSENVQRLILINPDNPSGHFLPKDEVLALCSQLEILGCEMVLDESFVDFADSSVRFSLFSSEVLEKHQNLIVIKSISKSYGVPGLRLGVLAADTERIKKISQHISIWNINSFGEFFLQIFAKYQNEYLDACDLIAAERGRFFGELETISWMRVIPSEANYFLCELEFPYAANDLARFLLHNHNILIKDCSGKDGIDDRQYIRIAVRGTDDNNQFLNALPQFIKNH